MDEESQTVENGVAVTELMEEDIKEQKVLITELKKKKEEQEQEIAFCSKDADTIMNDSESTSKKREREDEDQPLTFEFKEPEKEERVIATNSRVNRFNLGPRTKSFAWGVTVFVMGMGAV